MHKEENEFFTEEEAQAMLRAPDVTQQGTFSKNARLFQAHNRV
jgi:hypothetical protein